MKKIIVLLSGLILIVFSYGLVWSAPPPSSVTVINTTANPVPVTGNVGVTGNVAISNTPSVNISATSNPIPVTGNLSVSTASTTVLASGSLNVTTNTTVIPGTDVSQCDRVRFSINVPHLSVILHCIIYDALTQGSFDVTPTGSSDGSVDVLTFVLEPLVQSLAVQCSATDRITGVPTSAAVNYALYCR